MNHHHDHGATGVAAYCVVLLLAFVALALAVRYLGERGLADVASRLSTVVTDLVGP